MTGGVVTRFFAALRMTGGVVTGFFTDTQIDKCGF
jgi:hypothetical protein